VKPFHRAAGQRGRDRAGAGAPGEGGRHQADLVTDQTSAHDLINGYLPIGWTVAQWQAAQGDATSTPP